MNKTSFRFAFLAVLASSLSGCASPMRLFAKKPQPFEEFKAQQKAEQARIAGSHATPGGPVEVSELLHQGHAAFQQGNLQEAQSKYFAVVQRQPNHPVANHRLGVIADRQQDYLTAQRHYFAALNASPNDPNLLNDIGYSFLLQSQYPEAENYLQAALQKNPKQSNAINNLGLLYAKQGQPDRALAMFRMTNSEAEAQAKVARLMPSGLNPAAQPSTMMAQQGWPPQNPAAMNAAPYNPTSYNSNPYRPNPQNVAPTNPAVAASAGQVFGNPMGQSFNGTGQAQMSLPNSANNGWTPPDLTTPNTSSQIAQTAGVNDPNMPEATRRLKEQMESARLKAISDRQSRDNAERQRQEMLKRQLRDEELGRANIVNPVYSQPNGSNRWNGAPNSTAQNSGAPIVIGPPPSAANVPNATQQWQATPDGQSPLNGTERLNSPNNVMSPAAFGPAQAMPNQGPNSASGPAPRTGTGSPLDAMPTWPPPGSLPSITPNNSAAASSTNPGPNSGAWPNGFPPSMAEDPVRAASRLGMNAGSGYPFPITPGPSSSATNAPSSFNVPNSFSSPNPFNSFGAPGGVSPTTPPNCPANPNSPQDGAPTGEPPAGTFGSRNSVDGQGFVTTPNSPQDQLPPSAWYQTPGRFGDSSTGATQTQPASFGTNRSVGGTNAPPFGARATAADRSNGNERWTNGPIPGTQSVQTSTPTQQGYLAAPFGENSLRDYEQMIQMQNDEINRIRQQIDEQRQLPGSENFRRNQSSQPNGVSSRQ